MRHFAIALLFLIAAAPVRADLMSFSFSGTWSAGNVTSLGLLSAGDSFSGSLTWDTNAPNVCPGNVAYSLCIDLSSLSLNLPVGSGLSVTSLPDPKLNFAGALYVGTPPVLLDFQVNDKSSVDSQYYIFGFYPGSTGNPYGGAYVSNQGFSQYLRTTNYTSSGPAPVPEPSSIVLIVTVVAVLAIRRKRFWAVYEADVS